jgi:hypothetical protein
MAKQSSVKKELTFSDIVLNAQADVIKAAYEARVRIDDLLAERDEAYRRISELENQVEEIVGEPGAFAFPSPAQPVAGMSSAETVKRAKPKVSRASSPSGGNTASTDAGSSSKPAAGAGPEGRDDH